jgi:hypothetical protein
MLIGQTLCTNSSEYFKRDWNNYLSGNNVIYTNSNTSSKSNTNDRTTNNYNNYNNYKSSDNNRETDREYTLRMLNKTKEIFDREIHNLNQ